MQPESIQKKIYEIREQKVMLDFDLAELNETDKELKPCSQTEFKEVS